MAFFLNQHKYTHDLITLVGLEDTSSSDTPLEVNTKSRSEEGDLLPDPIVFRQLVGNLNYLTITCPDISFTDQQVSQFMHTPRHLHLAVVHRIIKYLRGTPSHGLFFPTGSPLRLVAYSDADWAGCPDTRRFVSGWCMFLGDSLISWKSKKQARVSKSSMESEYRAMSIACSKIVWLRGILSKVFLSLIQLLSMLTTLVLFKLLLILFIMSAQSILRWTVILFEKPWTLILFLFPIFLPPSR